MTRSRYAVAGLAIAAAGACGADPREPCSVEPLAAACTCDNLECAQVECAPGATTTVSGIVYAPNGTTPLPDVTVYVPNAEVAPFADALECRRCSEPPSGSPLVTATTGVDGRFVLSDVPATIDVPLVLQVGRWRRQIRIPEVAACADTPLPADATRLPRSRDEGDLPRFAITTGGSDSLECLLRKAGIADSEFTAAGGPGRVHLYAGVGGAARFDYAHGAGAFADAQTLWSDVASLSRYDVTLLSCEGGRHDETKPPAALAAMKQYADAGGRVFASHWHNIWIDSAPAPWPSVITRVDATPLLVSPATIDRDFARGDELARWLLGIGASPAVGTLQLSQAQHTVAAVDPAVAQRWIYVDDTPDGGPSVQYLSFTTPVEAAREDQCGRVVFSDLHAAHDDAVYPDPAFPATSCSRPVTAITPQELVLVFMLFEIASCIPDVES